MKNFAIIGIAGYIAPRHLKAIKDTNNQLVAAYDPNDSVGIIDSYFPNADFFTELERFDRHIEKLKKNGVKLDYLVVCSPNYLHDSHIRFGLRYGANVICEKPLVLNPWNVEALANAELEYQASISTILQLRLHPSVINLKNKVNRTKKKIYDIELSYITSRGRWYYSSWKGNLSKSGGVATNIGIHFFDMLLWIFGAAKHSEVHIRTHDRAAGYLELENARIKWFLSINPDTLPVQAQKENRKTFRSLRIAEEVFEFSGGFDELHTKSYEAILNGEGFGINEVRDSIRLVQQIRTQTTIGVQKNSHTLATLPLSIHPFKRER